MKRINIVAWHNGGGLSRDIDTLFDALPTERFAVTLNGAPREQARIQRRRIASCGQSPPSLAAARAAAGRKVRRKPVPGRYQSRLLPLR
ncbi:MAG: hypothetical protein IPG64_18655 [Haliea sp.]|nr:hypothetical protein [Haliea sp.]